MKILTPNAELVQQEPGLVGAYKQIEKVGRACWASENLITEDSYKTFVEGLMQREHNAPLEHGTIYLVSSLEIIFNISSGKKCCKRISASLTNLSSCFITSIVNVLLRVILIVTSYGSARG